MFDIASFLFNTHNRVKNDSLKSFMKDVKVNIDRYQTIDSPSI